MKKTSISILATAVLGLTTALNVGAQSSINFSSTPGSTIQFNGSSSTFQFNPSTSPIFGGIFLGSQWQIGSENGGTGSAIGLLGVFNNSPFSYGPITTTIVGSSVDESATVTGPAGALVINDGSGFNVTGNIDWVQLSTHNFGGAINSQVLINLTDLSYAGSNPDLMAFNGASGAIALTFQYAPGLSLADLSSNPGPYLTSYSGSITVVPEPTSTACLLLGLGALTVIRRVKQKCS
jgi:hypothetical protein